MAMPLRIPVSVRSSPDRARRAAPARDPRSGGLVPHLLRPRRARGVVGATAV